MSGKRVATDNLAVLNDCIECIRIHGVPCDVDASPEDGLRRGVVGVY